MSNKVSAGELAQLNPISFVPPTPRRFSNVGGTEFSVNTREISVAAIRPSPYQPRIRLDQDHIESLAESIKAARQIEPILVREIEEGVFELVAGEHRLEAVKLLDRDTILATVRQLTDAEAQLWALANNIKRRAISDYEAGKSLQALMDTKEVKSMTALATAVGITRQTAYRYLSLPALPASILEMLNEAPFLLGGSAGETLQGLINEGMEDLAVLAVKEVQAERLKQKDIETWVRAQAKAQTKPEEKELVLRPPAIVCRDDRLRASTTTKGHKISLNLECAKDLPPEAVTRLEAHLRALVKDFVVPDISDITMFKGT